MDIRIRQLVSKAAGTYFIVTDKSQVATIEAEAKMRLLFINSEKGAVNTLFKFAKGDKAGFTSVFGKSTRMQEKRGNFSISTCLDALNAGPIAVINLRAFSDLDTAGIAGINPNIQSPEQLETEYTRLFNRNGFWIPQGKTIPEITTEANYLNFANVGNTDLSIFVVKSKDISDLTAEGGKTLVQSKLEIDEYPALNFDMLVKDTFVDVYVFGNKFNVPGISTNQYYGHLFDTNGSVDLSKLDELSQIPESGFGRKFTGSIIPNLKSELDEQVSIDTLINQYYMTTGLICHINDDLLETDNKNLLDIHGNMFFDEDGLKIDETSPYLLSHVVPAELTKASVVYPLTGPDDNVEPLKANLITYGCEKDSDNSFIGSFEQGLRIDDFIKSPTGLIQISNAEILNENEPIPLTPIENLQKDSELTLSTIGRELTAEIVYPETIEGLTGFSVDALITSQMPIPLGTSIGVTYNGTFLGEAVLDANTSAIYLSELIALISTAIPTRTLIEAHAGLTDVWKFDISGTFEINVSVSNLVSDDNFVTSTIFAGTGAPVIVQETYTKVKYTCAGNIEFKNSDTQITKVNLFTETGLTHSFFIKAYKPREEQFLNGSASRQNEILDMMNHPGIVKGIKGSQGIRYVVDCFKSFVEPSYKYQYGQLMVTLDEGNKFVRAIINEPFVDDLAKSTNPLFKQTPTGTFDWSYVPQGGNKIYSTKLLTKFIAGAEFCFWFGPGNIDGSITKPLAGTISNLFYSKRLAFDVVANESGYVDGITELEVALDDEDRMYCEHFNWNPVINFNGGNTIFGNLTGLKVKSAQQQIHNSELLAFIKESLYNLSKSEAFKKGNYDDYLRTETEATNFMGSLALAGAIEPNPVVICNASNNTREMAKQKIKLVHIEYYPINALEKVVFNLEIR
jgi:hypothetical protein